MLRPYVCLTLALSVIWRCFYISVSRMRNPFLLCRVLNRPFRADLALGRELEEERELSLSPKFLIYDFSEFTNH